MSLAPGVQTGKNSSRFLPAASVPKTSLFSNGCAHLTESARIVSAGRAPSRRRSPRMGRGETCSARVGDWPRPAGSERDRLAGTITDLALGCAAADDMIGPVEARSQPRGWGAKRPPVEPIRARVAPPLTSSGLLSGDRLLLRRGYRAARGRSVSTGVVTVRIGPRVGKREPDHPQPTRTRRRARLDPLRRRLPCPGASPGDSCIVAVGRAPRRQPLRD